MKGPYLLSPYFLRVKAVNSVVYVFRDLHAYEIHVCVCVYVFYLENETILHAFLQLALLTQCASWVSSPADPALSDRVQGSPDVRMWSLVCRHLWWESAVDKT